MKTEEILNKTSPEVHKEKSLCGPAEIPLGAGQEAGGIRATEATLGVEQEAWRNQ